jgi:uncharacterized membrane protein
MSEPNVPPPPSYTPPPPPTYTPPPPGGASPNRGLMIVLSYLWLLGLIPLLVEKNDSEVQWHARNGLLLTAAEVAIGIILSILTSLIAFVDLGCTGCMVQSALFVIILVVHVMAIVKGVNGQRLIIPGLSQYADRPWF